MMNSNHPRQPAYQEQQEQRRRRPKVLCLGVSFPCMEQSAQQVGIPLPQSVLASLQAEEQQQQQQQQQDYSPAAATSAETSDINDIPCSSPSSVIGSESNDNNDNDHDTIHQITAMVQDCVQHHILTQMDGRDLIRCLITQHVCQVDVYTVSQESGAVYHPRCHLSANFNRSNFVAKLIKHFGNNTSTTQSSSTATTATSNSHILFDQVILDYFWIPLGWDAQHWTRNFFAQVLPNLVDVLQPDNGVIYLPFCCHCFQQVLVCRDILTRHYNISFVRRRRQRQGQTPGDDDDSEMMEMDEPIYLWQGTRHINAKIMQGVFGKRLDQEEVYCTFGPRHVKEGNLQDGAISQEIVLATCTQLEDFYDIRFIALRRIPPPPPPQQLDAEASEAAAAAVDDSEVAGAVSASSSFSSSLPSISDDTSTSVPAAVVTVTPVQQSHQPTRGQQQVESRRTLPLRTCRRLSEPKSALVYNNSPPPPSATKRALFAKNNNQTRNNSKKAARPKKNRGAILGLQDPRTIQHGFYSTATAVNSSNIDHKNSVVASTRTSTPTTRTTTKRVVTPTPAIRNMKRKTSFSSSSPLPSRQDDDEQEEMVDKKPKSLF